MLVDMSNFWDILTEFPKKDIAKHAVNTILNMSYLHVTSQLKKGTRIFTLLLWCRKLCSKLITSGVVNPSCACVHVYQVWIVQTLQYLPFCPQHQGKKPLLDHMRDLYIMRSYKKRNCFINSSIWGRYISLCIKSASD